MTDFSKRRPKRIEKPNSTNDIGNFRGTLSSNKKNSNELYSCKTGLHESAIAQDVLCVDSAVSSQQLSYNALRSNSSGAILTTPTKKGLDLSI
eukprot:Awhi_evm1s15290